MHPACAIHLNGQRRICIAPFTPPNGRRIIDSAAHTLARIFADHRRRAAGFPDYPGDLPASLDAAYAVQAAAIAQWDAPIAGWKVGRITGESERLLGENRFVGPIFADGIWPARDTGPSPFPAIPGGFAALEAELVAVIAAPDADGTAAVRSWHAGIEVAGSPLATINDLGPLASIAGFGNNLGLILGPELTIDDPDAVACTTIIDGTVHGPRTAGLLPGGPRAAVDFAIRRLTMLGQPIPEGTLISTGAITGVHAVEAGQSGEVCFAGGPTLRFVVVPATAAQRGHP